MRFSVLHSSLGGALCALLTLTLTAREPKAVEALQGLDQTIEEGLKSFNVPGISVAVVVGDEVVLAKGYGWRDVAGKKRMTADTLQPIASMTKQFAVASLATLVRQGKLDWDVPVRNYLPDFRLEDEHATAAVSARDLVTHRTGLPRHDAVWFGTDLTREQLYQRLRYLPLSKDLRERFQYNNLMFMTAGYLGGKLAGTTWEELTKRELLQPLGMQRTNFQIGDLLKDPDHSEAYELNTKREVVRIEYKGLDAAGPAGSMNSSVTDLANYARMILAGGKFGGKQVLLEADVQAMLEPKIPIGRSPMPEFGFSHYGMGLFTQTYRGVEIAHHGGNIEGASSMIVFVPAKRIAVVVLANRTVTSLRDALPYEIIDRLLGLPSAGMLARHLEVERKSFASEDAAKAEGATDRKKDTKPAHALADYVGDYVHPGYGRLKVALGADGRLTLAYNGFVTPLEHWHYEVFRAPADRQNALELTQVMFQSGFDGEVSSLVSPFEPNVAPTHFEKRPPAEMQERKFLDQLVGEYQLPGNVLTISVRDDNVLLATQLGRVRELVPIRGTTFKLKDLAGVSVEFLRDASGKFDRYALHQAGGESLIVKRVAK